MPDQMVRRRSTSGESHIENVPECFYLSNTSVQVGCWSLGVYMQRSTQDSAEARVASAPQDLGPMGRPARSRHAAVYGEAEAAHCPFCERAKSVAPDGHGVDQQDLGHRDTNYNPLLSVAILAIDQLRRIYPVSVSSQLTGH